LNRVLLFIFDNFDGVEAATPQIDALYNLTKSALAEVLHYFISVTIWRVDYLVLA
jgi:hypothetical protein